MWRRALCSMIGCVLLLLAIGQRLQQVIEPQILSASAEPSESAND